MSRVSIGVIGAGAIGLSSAINIQRSLPTAQVTIYADRFDEETTSHGAGGLFRPNTDHLHGVDKDTVTRWSEDGFKFFSDLALSAEASSTGHMVMPGYILSHKPIQNPLYKGLVYSFKELNSTELKKLNVDYKYGYQVTTVITDTSIYLTWLMSKFKDAGGIVIKRTIQSLEEFVGVHGVVVNCSGFRARDLVGDTSVYPVRGHLLKMKAPWIKYWLYTEEGTYFIPSFGGFSLGGIRQKDNFSLEIDPKDTEGILERAHKLWPSVKGAQLEREWVDLRPHRDPVRLEKETLNFQKGPLKVVHNYGHGALGITLSWGTAIDAANLTVKALSENASKL